MVSVFRHGINNDDIGPIAKASFEETPEMFMKAARHGELDPMRGLSANVLCGQRGHFGTNAFDVLLDASKLGELNASADIDTVNNEALIRGVRIWRTGLSLLLKEVEHQSNRMLWVERHRASSSRLCTGLLDLLLILILYK